MNTIHKTLRLLGNVSMIAAVFYAGIFKERELKSSVAVDTLIVDMFDLVNFCSMFCHGVKKFCDEIGRCLTHGKTVP